MEWAAAGGWIENGYGPLSVAAMDEFKDSVREWGRRGAFVKCMHSPLSGCTNNNQTEIFCGKKRIEKSFTVRFSLSVYVFAIKILNMKHKYQF